MNEGWKCPECNTIYAPFIITCKCSKIKTNVYAISVATKDDLHKIDVNLHPKEIIVGVDKKYYKLNTLDNWTQYHPGKQVILLNI